MTDIPILTAPFIEGLTIVEYKGLVTARNVRGINVVRDLHTACRDVFGGRSGAYEEVMADMEQEVLNEIQTTARQLGANAVIAFSLDFDNIGSKGKSLIMAYGRGTADVLQ